MHNFDCPWNSGKKFQTIKKIIFNVIHIWILYSEMYLTLFGERIKEKINWRLKNPCPPVLCHWCYHHTNLAKKQWFPLAFHLKATESFFPFPSITCMQRKLAPWAVNLLQVFGRGAGKGLFLKIVTGVTWHSCIKTDTEYTLIVSVNGVCESLPRGVKTLDQNCLGEQSLFVNIHFVTGVTVTGVTMLMVTPVTEW